MICFVSKQCCCRNVRLFSSKNMKSNLAQLICCSTVADLTKVFGTQQRLSKSVPTAEQHLISDVKQSLAELSGDALLDVAVAALVGCPIASPFYAPNFSRILVARFAAIAEEKKVARVATTLKKWEEKRTAMAICCSVVEGLRQTGCVVSLKPNASISNDGDEWKPIFVDEQQELLNAQVVVVQPKQRALGNGFLSGCQATKIVVYGDETDQVEEAVESFGHGCFSNCPNLAHIEFHFLRHARRIGDGFLHNCPSLASADFIGIAFVEEIGGGWLSGCRSLKQVEFSSMGDLKMVGDSWLSGCSELCSVDFSGMESLVEIVKQPFTGDHLWMADCPKLTPLSVVNPPKLKLPERLPYSSY